MSDGQEHAVENLLRVIQCLQDIKTYSNYHLLNNHQLLICLVLN